MVLCCWSRWCRCRCPQSWLALTAAEREAEDGVRQHALYADLGDRVVERLGPEDERFTTTIAGLGAWARRLGREVEEMRQAFLALLAPGFCADADVARLAEDTPFAVTVDWGVVHWTRTVLPLRCGDDLHQDD